MQEDLTIFGPSFAQGFAGVEVKGGEATPSLFAAQPASAPAYQVGGVIHDVRLKICHTIIEAKNEASVGIQWQVYSNVQGKVVATIETSGSAKFVSPHVDGKEAIRQAFVANVKELSQDAQMKALLAAASQEALPSAAQGRIAATAPRQGSRTPAEAVSAVVLVSTPGGHGSGVLVSSDGYILTDAHVVDMDQVVKVRWFDGVETEGRVVRLHKARDVALIKADPHGQAPLAVRQTAVQPGEGVFAIGAPFDKNLQGTVTRGIVSASRVMDGMSFIQSDVTVSPGNSGGPLIDEKGQVIGLTDWGYIPQGFPAGLNFFIPVRDALDFLNLDLAPAGPVTGTAPLAPKTAALKASSGASAR